MPTNQPADRLTVAQTAQHLGITERAVRYRIKNGTLPATKLGHGTAPYLINRADLPTNCWIHKDTYSPAGEPCPACAADYQRTLTQ